MDESALFWKALARPRLLGLALALVAFQQSLAPSLLVRDWYFQGVVSGVAVAVGYGIGAGVTRLVAWGVRRSSWTPPRLTRRTDQRLRLGVLVALVGLVALMSRHAVAQHRWTWERLDHSPSSSWLVYAGTIGVTLLVAGLLLAVGLAVAWLRRSTARAWGRVLPRWIAGAMATVLVAWALASALNAWVYERTLDGLNASFTLSDLEIEDGVTAPESMLRSTGPASEVAWEEVGDEGRRFLTRGPSVERLQEFRSDGEPAAVEPVRVFVGRATTSDPEEQAGLALEEMERFDAFDRSAILVVVPTGTGWVNEQIVQPLEYLYGGDVATVSVQYSHLPSPLAFLTESHAAGDAGAALVDAVRERIQQEPEAERPRLLVAGESLGSFGGGRAYASLGDLLADADASLWVGPPATMHLRREAEQQRAPGSLQIKPELGPEVLFANRASDITGHPRSVFLQQADDPIVWWDWPVLWEEPDWLREPLDPAVNPDMEWYPVTTFLNLAVDMAVSNAFEEEQGHMYGTQPTLAWAAMLQPDGWDDERVAALRTTLAGVHR
ncbi:alpha/beta-hydrolase family protein [Nocardioides jishulii]|uniref:Alpha/beta-hydrolase family protein n=1 Tax=Nocardioides jishulii TaxID=2575440 RepID=A0A4U2YSP6_9ACTN|nr:alpha/beta-hydrolase family protein [Nocardioides jishulii]QCX28920.1 hypothetical protein FCL41_16375 [Nocardioides jishulii]TKI64180.1 hypothetical protein FC770_03190 [Nocardioides jishulii]